MQLTFEAFFYDFKDLQVDYFNSAQFAYVTENAGGSETKGAELQFNWATPVDGLYLTGSIGYLSSTFTDFESFCATGQTAAQGCILPPPPATETAARQNLDGNDRPGAPEWSGFVGVNYDRSLGNNLLWGVSANAQFKSEQNLIAQDPTAKADSYQTYDANIRIGAADRTWQVALIGKNLSDEYVFRGGGNVPGTGGNTGTAEGYPSDLQGVAIRPRQVELEFTYNF